MCDHKDYEDCLICHCCGKCSESLDEDDTCYSCDITIDGEK